MARIGVFGGTFDPPHYGHLILADIAAQQLALSRVLWMVAGQSPFKQGQATTPAEIRAYWVQIAIADNPQFAITRVDLDRPAPHYTSESLALLQAQFPQDSFFFLMGADSLASFARWRAPETILQLAQLAVLRRPASAPDIAQLTATFPTLAERLHWVNAPQIEISSHQIRADLATGHSVRYFLPPAVLTAVQQWRSGTANMSTQSA
ncbi:MAG TPA: nicotinate-nucleotide adenylyltransferase [Anaerolineales bacterium]|nr:nicotinate-nucleotide adenylyltransferase [Anaerolineales bacterium]